MRAAILVMLAVLASGCGSEEATRPAQQPPPPPPAPPTEPKPKLVGVDGPPPAWLETDRGSFWLGHSTFCWKTTCADYVAPKCGDERHVPTITVHRGELVTAHLGFEPREVTLTQFPPAGEPERLPTRRDPSWRVDRDGVFALFAVAKERGDASYVACLELAR